MGFMGFSRLQISKPTIASVTGHCVTGGFELALGAIFGSHRKELHLRLLRALLGIPLVDGGAQRLPLVVRLSRAPNMTLIGCSVERPEAYQIGLVDRLVHPTPSRK